MFHSTTVRRRTTRAGWLASASLLALAAPILTATPATAFDFSAGNWSGHFDTTFTYGLSLRVEDRDQDLIGISNGGNRFSINGDDGNLNYNRSIFANAVRGTHEFELDNNGFGVFTRFTYFYDFENADGDNTDFKPLTDQAKERVGSDIRLLDAYLYGGFEAGDVPIDLRFGNQIISWGESTFIQNGINSINPIDVNAIRIPGSELRDALEPIPAFKVNADLNQNFSLEGFYQFAWTETRIDASGTFFSNNDFASPGGSTLFLGFGDPLIPDSDAALLFPNGPAGSFSFGAAVPRGRDDKPSDGGQYGFAGRYFTEALGGAEFGLYYLNYHSRVPVISASLADGTALGPGGTPSFFASSEYFTEYPEDIQLIGASFNTGLPGGASIQGEVSYRIDQPLQVDDVELLLAANGIATVSQACAGGPSPTCTAVTNAVNAQGNQVLRDLGVSTPADYIGQLGQTLDGSRDFDVIQAQATVTQLFSPIESIGVDQWAVVGEVGFTQVLDFPEKSRLRFDGPNTPQPGGGSLTTATGFFVPQQTDGFADEFSWGYRIRARFDMFNAIGPVNLFPVLGWAHDVGGTTPLPLGNFIENRAAFSVGLNFSFLEKWTGGIQYTNFFAIGDDEFNMLRDRDFISLNVKYSF